MGALALATDDLDESMLLAVAGVRLDRLTRDPEQSPSGPREAPRADCVDADGRHGGRSPRRESRRPQGRDVRLHEPGPALRDRHGRAVGRVLRRDGPGTQLDERAGRVQPGRPDVGGVGGGAHPAAGEAPRRRDSRARSRPAARTEELAVAGRRSGVQPGRAAPSGHAASGRGHRGHETKDECLGRCLGTPSTGAFDHPVQARGRSPVRGRRPEPRRPGHDHDRSTHHPRPEGGHVPRGGGVGQARADGDEPRRAAPGRHGAGGRASPARRPDRRARAPAPGQRSNLVHRVLGQRPQGRDSVVPEPGSDRLVRRNGTTAGTPPVERGRGKSRPLSGRLDPLHGWFRQLAPSLGPRRRPPVPVPGCRLQTGGARAPVREPGRSPHPVASTSHSPPGKRSCSSTSPPGPPATISIGGTATSRDGTWHPDGVRFALATGGEVRIWDARTERARRHVRDPRAATSAVSTTAPTAPAWSSPSCQVG